ncbi:MAG: MAPEG family protein [Amylibacter sp.]|nr:MAPEG family protein [Amylibacter sp.]
MTVELTVLALAGILQLLQLLIYVIAGDRQIGLKTAMGNRDDKPELTGIPARLQRAYNNHFESLALFTIAVVVVTLSNQSSPLTQTCAWVYLAARALYVPAYAYGLSPWRSIIWTIAIGAATIMLLATLL